MSVDLSLAGKAALISGGSRGIGAATVRLFTAAGACAALAGIGIGVMIATVSKSQQQAQLLTLFVNPVFTLLSGATSPIDNIELALHVSDIGATPAVHGAPG